jgi:DNA-binding cell septation regulator SpoVG
MSRLLSGFIAAHQSGDPRAERHVVLDVLSGQTWSWDQFDRWLARFSAEDRWPRMWADVREAGRDQNQDLMNTARCGLLHHTLVLKSYRARDGMKPAYVAMMKKRGWDYSFADCPVEQEIALAMRHGVTLDDWRTYPPFFPGDRTMIVIKRRT